MTGPLLLFSAVENAEGMPVGTTQFQVNPEALRSPEETGALIYHLQTHLAQAFVEFGHCPDYVTALSGIMQGAGDALDHAIAEAQGGRS